MNDARELRDPALDAFLGEHSTETPPAHIDAAILAAAHRAVDSSPHPARATQAWRWWMPLAAAAVIGAIVVGIMPLAPTLRDESSAIVSDAPPTAPRETTASDSAAVAPSSRPLPAATTPPRAAARDGASAGALAKVAPSPEASAGAPAMVAPSPTVAQKTVTTLAPFPPAPPLKARVSADQPASAASVNANASPPAPSRAWDPAHRKKQAGSAKRSDVAWFTQIRNLRAQGKVSEAAQALVRFREAFPDADERLPPDLRRWAASVPRTKR